MRFEIRTGGVTAILVGLFALSLVVFLFGVDAGYEIGLQSLANNAQTSTTYSVTPPAEENPAAAPATSAEAPVAPAAEEAPASVAPIAPLPPPANSAGINGAEATPSPASAAAVNAAAHKVTKPSAEKIAKPAAERKMTSSGIRAPALPKPSASIAPPEAAPADNGEAAETSPAEVPAPEESPATATDTAASEETPAAGDTHAPHHRPYNIQIQAAMDLNGANRMMQRLESLGYQPHLSPTQIAGQTWYRVEVGPYTTPEEAAAAEATMRQKYNTTFGGGSPPAHSGN